MVRWFESRRKQGQTVAEDALSLEELVATLARATNSAHVLVAAAFLEDQLRKAITTQFRADLSNTLSERLFEGYGPLSSFSAKIDLAFAMRVIDQIGRQDFHVIREIRNAFAHPQGLLHYEAEEITRLCAKFSGAREGRTNADLYNFKIGQCTQRLSKTFEAHYLVKALQNYVAQTPLPTPEAATD